MKLKCVIFDMDGTVVDVPYDWESIKKELMIQGDSILNFIHKLNEEERTKKWKILEKYENEATMGAILKEGIPEFLDFLDKSRIKKALVTNNSRRNVDFLLKKFHLKFDCVVSRESGLWKPSGAPLIAALRILKLNKEECCVVGDSHFDIKAAEEAGINRVFILNKDEKKFASTKADIFPSVKSLRKRIEYFI